LDYDIAGTRRRIPRDIQYLVHVNGVEGVAINLENIEAIMDWPAPRNVT
jgi:hypothetical protein